MDQARGEDDERRARSSTDHYLVEVERNPGSVKASTRVTIYNRASGIFKFYQFGTRPFDPSPFLDSISCLVLDALIVSMDPLFGFIRSLRALKVLWFYFGPNSISFNGRAGQNYEIPSWNRSGHAVSTHLDYFKVSTEWELYKTLRTQYKDYLDQCVEVTLDFVLNSFASIRAVEVDVQNSREIHGRAMMVIEGNQYRTTANYANFREILTDRRRLRLLDNYDSAPTPELSPHVVEMEPEEELPREELQSEPEPSP